MASALRATPINHDGGWVTTPENALSQNADFAKSALLGNQCQYYGFDFSRLPATINITGVSVRLEASKDHIAGSGDPAIEVALSWDSGSTWTSGVKTTNRLGLLNQSTFILGGVDEEWSHTPWTRPQVVDVNVFRVRVEAAGLPTSSPGWRLHWLTATVHYENVDTPATAESENISISETLVSSILHDILREPVNMHDAGSQSQTAPRPPRGSLQITQSGTAVTLLESDSDFSATAERPARSESFGAAIQLGAGGPTVYVGDATVLTAPIATFPFSYMQAGLLSVEDLTSEATFLEGFFIPTVQVNISNLEYVDQSDGSDLVPKKLSEHALGVSSVGRALTVWGMAESGDGWKKRVVFNGDIEDIQFFDNEIIVRGIQLGTTQKACPDIIVDENLFAYEPGSSAEDTGEQIEGNKGKVVPIGIGRFDYSAVKKESDHPTGHPFRFTAQSPLPTEDKKIYSQIALFPAMMGLKHPMMPTIHVARRYRNVENVNIRQSEPWQNVLLYGTRKSSPHLDVSLNYDNPSTTFAMQYPNYDTFSVNDVGLHNNDRYVLAWTWHTSDHGSRGMPCVKPISEAPYTRTRVGIGLSGHIPRHGSAGPMEHLGRIGIAPPWTDGTAMDAYGLFINIRGPAPKLSPLGTSVDWPGVWQTIALQMAGITKRENATASFDQGQFDNPLDALGGLVQFPDYGISPRFETKGVTDEENCIKLDQTEAFSSIAGGGSLSLEIPIDGPNLGTPRLTKFCMLWNSSTSDATEVRLLARFGPQRNYGIINVSSSAPGADYNLGRNVEFDTSTYDVPILKLTGTVNDRSFASFNLAPYFDPHYNRLANMHETDAKEFFVFPAARVKIWQSGRYKAPWSFLARDGVALAGAHFNETFHWPGDVMIQAIGGKLDLIACWFEVVHQSRLGNDSKEPLVQEFSFQHDPTRRINAAGERTETIPGELHETTVSLGFTRPNPRLTAESSVFVTGKGLIDWSGEITGVTNRIVENPVDICSALIRHYLGDSVFKARATGTDFGSFDTARTILGATTYRMTVVINPVNIIRIKRALFDIAVQSKSVIREHLDANGNKQWIFYVDTENPKVTDPDRMYTGFTNDFIKWDNMAKATFSASLVPYEDLSSSVTLRYGLHLPTGTWSGNVFCTPESTNFVNFPEDYKTEMSFARTEYNVDNHITIDAPDVWDPAVAEVLCKWHCDLRRRRRVFVEFETYANAFDLEPGHVIQFDDEIGDRIPYPGEGNEFWKAHQFNVEQVSTSKVAGQLARVYVRALEVHSEA